MLRVLFACVVSLIVIGCNGPDQVTQVIRANPLIGTWTNQKQFSADSLLVIQLTFNNDQSTKSSQSLYIKNKLSANTTYNGNYTVLNDVLYLQEIGESNDYKAKFEINNNSMRIIGVVDSDTSYWTKK